MIQAVIGHKFAQICKSHGQIINLNIMEQVLYASHPLLIVIFKQTGVFLP